MKSKRLLFLILAGLTIPNLGSCSAPIFVDKIIVDGKDKIDIGETTTFKAEIYPTPKSETTVNWSVSDPNIAFIDSNGNLTGINKGKVTISANVGQTVSKQDIYIGGFIEHPVESISIGGVGSLNVGEYAKLDITFIPENATNKDVIWTSSNPKILSVNESGVVKGENYTINENKAVITATSKDGNKVASTTISVKENTDKLTIKSFSKPNCLIHYEQVIENSEDKIIEDNINRDNSKNYVNNKFYKYDASEKMKQIYKVGNDNPFKFKCNITTSNGDPFKEIHDNNPYQKFTLLVKTGEETYNDVTEQYKPNSYKGNEIQFNKTDAGKTFKLTVEPDPDNYIVDPSMNATLEFQVIDGYNAYDFAGLTTVDNWTTSHARDVFNSEKEWNVDARFGLELIESNKFVDLWADYKNKHGIKSDADYKATILHNDIIINPSDLPNNIIWTDKEVADYVNGKKFEYSKTSFDDFVELKKNVHQDDWKDLSDSAIRAKCIYLLKNSRKDYTSIFIRQMDNDFRLEGNYFNIDASNIKPVTYFDLNTLSEYYRTTIHYSSIISFGLFDRGRIYDKKTSYGEEAYDYYRPYQCQNDRGAHPDRGIEPKNSYINNLSLIGNAKKDGTHDEGVGGENAFISCGHFSNFTNIITQGFTSSFLHNGEGKQLQTQMIISKCKAFDNFSDFVRINTADLTIINDSFMKDSSCGAIRMIEDENFSFVPHLELNNCYLECFISGDEIANKNSGPYQLFKGLAVAGYNAFNKYNKTEFGKDGQYSPKNPRNFIKVEDDTIYINLIVQQQYTSFLNNVNPGKSTIKVNNKMLFNLETDGNEGPIEIYNRLPGSRILGSVSFKSSVGGHARLPILKSVELDNLECYDENVEPYSILSNHLMSLSDYVLNKKDVDINIPTVPKNYGDLFSGDYLTCYFKPLIAYMMAFVLGYK